jgi:hypothetical protein
MSPRTCRDLSEWKEHARTLRWRLLILFAITASLGSPALVWMAFAMADGRSCEALGALLAVGWVFLAMWGGIRTYWIARRFARERIRELEGRNNGQEERQPC